MIARRVLAALLAGAIAGAGVAAVPAAAATGPSATVLVAPDGGGVVRAGRPVSVQVQVTNTGTTDLAPGDLAFSLDQQPVASASTLLSSIAKPPQVLLGYAITGTKASVPSIAPGASTTVRATISAKDVASIVTEASGARILYARYASGTLRTVAESALVKMSGRLQQKVGFGTVVPVLAPAGTTGLVDTAAQQALTDPGGGWDAAVRAAEAAPWATVALDPAVIASVRLAGDKAPPAAQDLLGRLERLPNQVVALPYADGDVTLERAAGTARTLRPTGFAGTSAEAVGGTTASPTPAPTASVGASGTSVDDLTRWDWSDQDVAWPVPGTTTAADVAALGKEGDTLLLASTDVRDTPARRTAGPLARVGASSALVADATASTLLAAASAGTGPSADAALAQLTGVLATAAVTGETSGVLAMVGRSTATEGLDRALSVLARQPWLDGRSLERLAQGAQATPVDLRPGTTPAARVSTARGLLAAERSVRSLRSAITADAEVVTAPARLALLGALSAGWRGRDAEWSSASSAIVSAFGAVTDSVSIPKQSGLNAIGSDGRLTVNVANALDVPVKVVVRATVSNGRLQFNGDSTVTVSVPANAVNHGQLSFRTITNGSTDVTLRLETPSGASIGEGTKRTVSVSAGFDTVVAVVLLVALGLLLGLGVYRNVTRRRRPRTAAA